MVNRAHTFIFGATVFTLAASVGVVFSLLSEIGDEYGVSSLGLGMFAAAPLFTSVASQIWLAPLADRGRTRQLLVGGLAVAAVSLVGIALATNTWQFVVARALSGVGIGAFLPAARATITRVDRDRAGEFLGRLASVQVLGFITGPMFGAELVARFELSTPFWAFAVAVFVALLVVSRLSVSEVPVDQRETKPLGKSMLSSLQLLRLRPVLVAVIGGAALIVPSGLYEAVWDVYLTDLGASTRFVGWSLAAYGVPFAVFAPLGGRAADRHGPIKIGLGVLVGVVPLTAIYGMFTSYQLLAGMVLFEAVFNGFGIPAMQAAMVKATKPSDLAAGQGLVGAAGELGAGFTALFSGFAYDRVGPEILFASVAAIVAAMGISAYLLHESVVDTA